MTNTTAIETIEDYLVRLEDALAPQGVFRENELIGDMVRILAMYGVDWSEPPDVIRRNIATEIELQLRDIDFWRDDLTVQVERIDWDCFEVQNGGQTLVGTLTADFSVCANTEPLWGGNANIFCDQDLIELLEQTLEDGLEDEGCDQLADELDDVPEDEVETWWLAHGLDVEAITEYWCRWVDIALVYTVLDGQEWDDHLHDRTRYLMARKGGAL